MGGKKMLRSIDELMGFRIQAKDDIIGNVKDVYFDDHKWRVRYLVADTGRWLTERLILLSPVCLRFPDWSAKLFPVNLTRTEIEKSPALSRDLPVSREKELEMIEYYHWPLSWEVPVAIPVQRTPRKIQTVGQNSRQAQEKMRYPHLRSSKDVIGYNIKALDGDIGHAKDFIFDDSDWIIRYMVVDTQNHLPGKTVIASPNWIDEVSWEEQKIHLDVKRDEINYSPAFTTFGDLNMSDGANLLTHAL
jgi:hypothetical protein